MKANETPEKIYISPKVFNIGEYATKVLTTKYEDNIEYTRTDAFIEKAKKWFERQNEWRDINGIKHCDMESFEDFKNYMKGE